MGRHRSMAVVMRVALLAITQGLVLTVVVATQGAGPQLVTEWLAEPGGQADVMADSILVRRGTIRTARLYSDFVFRFEFRLRESTAVGSVLVRSRFGYGASERGYRIALTNRMDGSDALGRSLPINAGMKETAFTLANLFDRNDGWQRCEIRAERGALSVRVNGVVVSSAEKLDEFTGHIALQARRGSGIEFRDPRVERLPSAGEPFGQGAIGRNETGVVLPRAIKTAMPFYAKEPHDQWIQGVVGLELVVEPTGEAGDIRVVKPLHPDLDEAAMASARQWRFNPGTRSGQAIPVIVTMEVSFRRTQ